MVFSALPSFAQTWTANLAATEPTFVALDTVGGTTYLYVAEHGDVPTAGAQTSNGGRILKYNLTSGSTTPAVIASHGTGNGQFISPDAIAIDPSTHDLYIADRYLDRVTRITNTGTYVMKFGSGTVGAPDEMHGPVGVAVDGSGAVYVTEHGSTNSSTVTAGDMVSKFTVSGTTATRVWRKGNGLNTPYSVTVGGSSLYISDGFNQRVQVWDLNGNPTGSFNVGGIALGGSFDGSGNFWMGVAGGDFASPQEIVKINSGGTVAATFGAPGSGNGQFALPFDVAVNSATNTAYVADYHNNRVQVINLAASAPAVPAINSSATASGTVGQNFTYQVTATNSPTSFAAVDALPAGLTLNTTTGAITGIPSTAGSVTTHLTATNASGASSQFALAFTIAAASGGNTGTPALPLGPTITHIDLAPGTVVQGVSAQWDVTFSEAVTGVDASDFAVNTQGSATASITGVTGSGANYRVQMNYTDQNGSIQIAVKTANTGITGASGAFRGVGHTASPVYGTGATNASDVTRPQVNTVTAGTPSGNNVSFTVTFSEPVTGVDASDFIVSGTSGTVGAVTGSGATYTVPVTASGSGTVTLNVIGGATSNIRDAATNILGGAGTTSGSATISGGGGITAPTISNQTATGTQNAAFNYQVSASGATSYSVTAGTLPAGLTLNGTTGAITGTPTGSGSTTVTVQATNTAGSASAQLTITISPVSVGSAPTISSATTASATVGTSFSYQINASNSPTSYAATNLAGTGLSLNTTTGAITGTPTNPGTITSSLTATNAIGTSAPVTLTITVSPASTGSAPTINSATTANGTVGSAFSYQISASGSPTSYAATNLAGTGLSLNTTTGAITGTPTTAGTITSSLTASNANGASAPVTLTITVSAANNGSAPSVTNASLPLTAGTPMSYQVSATNSPTSYTIVGQPLGVDISSTGLISGVPWYQGTYVATVTAKNASGTGTGTITFNVAPLSGGNGGGSKKAQTVTLITPVSTIFVGQPLKLVATTTSNLPITYSVVSGDAQIVGDMLTANSAGSIIVRAAQAGDSTWASAQTDQTFTAQKQQIDIGQTVKLPVKAYTDGSIDLPATSPAGNITYTVVSGSATIQNGKLVFNGSGPVTVRATVAGNNAYVGSTSDLVVTGSAVPRLVNLSSRLKVSAKDADGATIAGFYVFGSDAKQFLIRAVGPTLAKYGVTNALANATLTVRDSKGNVVGTNAGWNNNAQITTAGRAIGAFDLNADSKDAAILLTLQPGAYTVQVQSADSSGTVLIETYDMSANAAVPTRQLINISTRGSVSAGDQIINGFSVSDTKKVLIRAVGPGLTAYGVANVMADPMITVYDSKGAVVATNDNWGTQVAPATAASVTTAANASGAFPLVAGSNDASIVLDLAAGSYTAVITGANSSTGNVLVEVYEVPNP